MQDVLFHTQGAFGIITLNRSKALNALTTDMCLLISDQLTRWQDDSAIAAVMIKSDSERAFCAGGDIRFLYQSHADNKIELADAFIYHEYHLNRQIAEYPKPYVALLDGLTMGGGVGLSVHGSHRIASEKVIWAMPETAIGLFPDIGASFFLSRLGTVGTYLGLTGNRITAEILLNLGLIEAIVPSTRMETLAQQLCELKPHTDIYAQIDHCIASFHESTGIRGYPHQQYIEDCFGLSTVEAMIDTLQTLGHEPWAIQTYQELLLRSPTSLKITLAALERGKNMDLAACLAQEQRLAYRCLRERDLFEGIRAAVIDKDQSPHWHPAHLNEVTSAVVNSYFDSPVNLWDNTARSVNGK